MKATTYIINSLIFNILIVLPGITAYSQGSIQTPMGKTVYLTNNWDNTIWISTWESDAADWINEHNSDARRIGPATSNYNCHSFAWNVTEGGISINAWLNQQTDAGQPNLSKYWTNDAYASTLYVSNNQKVFYSSGDHSAITTDTLGKVESKWGWWPLYEHSTAQCPFSSSTLIYYKLKTPTINSATGVVCTGSQRTVNNGFTASNWSYDWSAAGFVNEVSGDFTSNYTIIGSSGAGYGYIYLTITSPSGMVASSQKNIGVNMPMSEDLSYSLFTSGGTPVSFMCPNRHYHIYLNNNSGCTLSNYTWSVPSAWSINYTYNNMISIYTNSLPGGMVEVRANTCCGIFTKVKTGYFGGGSCGSSYTMNLYPNPSTGETTVTIDPASEGVVFDENAEWRIEIFDQNFVLIEQKDKLKGRENKINTTGWKTGYYFVRIKYRDEYLQSRLVVE